MAVITPGQDKALTQVHLEQTGSPITKVGVRGISIELLQHDGEVPEEGSLRVR